MEILLTYNVISLHRCREWGQCHSQLRHFAGVIQSIQVFAHHFDIGHGRGLRYTDKILGATPRQHLIRDDCCQGDWCSDDYYARDDRGACQSANRTRMRLKWLRGAERRVPAHIPPGTYFFFILQPDNGAPRHLLATLGQPVFKIKARSS